MINSAVVRCVMLALLGALIGVLTVAPMDVRAPATFGDLDLSWQLSLGAALTHHLQFGTEYLFTYGPLGFLHLAMKYTSDALTFSAAAVDVIAHVGYAVALLLLADSLRRRLRLGVIGSLALIAATILAAYWSDQAADIGNIFQFIALICFGLALAAPQRRPNPLILAAVGGALLALAALYKVDLLEVGLVELLVFTCGYLALRNARVWVVPLAWAGFAFAYFGVWLALGQRLLDLPAFWRGSWELSAGYSSAMAAASDWKVLAVIALLVILGTIFPLFILPTNRSRPAVVQATLILMTTPLLFSLWEEALVRPNGLTDGRAVEFAAAAMAVSWIVAVFAPSAKSWSMGAPAIAGVICAVTAVAINGPLLYTPWLPSLLSPTKSVAPTVVLPSDAGLSNRELAELRGHSVNALPWAAATVLDNHLPWDPLPVPQIYSAYTPYLDALDARQLASRHGATRLVLSMEDIDGRYLLWDAPAVWDQILSRYSCESRQGITAIMSRRPNTVGPATPFSRRQARFNHWIQVPPASDRSEYVSIKLDTTLGGAILTAALRQSPVFVSFRLSNGQLVPDLRLVSSTASGKMYVSRYVATPAQLCEATSNRTTNLPSIRSIMLTTAHRFEWRQTLRVTFEAAAQHPFDHGR